MSPVLVRAGRIFMAMILAATILTAFAIGSQTSGEWANYKPAHSLGSGENDWWISYPAQSTQAGGAVAHPQWALDALKTKPVLIFDHSKECTSCVEQKANIEKVLASYGKNVTYYDMLVDPGSSDKRAYEIFSAYSLIEGQYYVPTTVLITLIKDSDGKVKVAWHSAEDAMNESDILSYVKDAIYYHNLNSLNWSK